MIVLLRQYDFCCQLDVVRITYFSCRIPRVDFNESIEAGNFYFFLQLFIGQEGVVGIVFAKLLFRCMQQGKVASILFFNIPEPLNQIIHGILESSGIVQLTLRVSGLVEPGSYVLTCQPSVHTHDLSPFLIV